MKKWLIVAATSLLLLSSCTKEEATTPAPDQAQTDQAEPTKTEGAEPPASTGTQAQVHTPAEQSATGETAKPTEPKNTAELKYKMDKAYNIVPIQEGSSKKVVLLTFDDGPKKKEMINGLIDVLDKHHAKAIFFVNGYRVKEHPELLKLIHDRGQIIGNHSWDHIELRKLPAAKVKKQIEDVQQIVEDTIGEAPVFFRPPFGTGGDIGRQVAKENGLLYMTWSNGSLDWTMKSKDQDNPTKLMNNVLEQLHPGSNILMHELPWTVEGLDSLLSALEKKGYSFVDPNTISIKDSE
ncbi:xylanase deacetylase [Paenibacillus sp. CAA11]|uniref:polysaccharide deacetylase family protein n=1 Tax=Paenibacillus sp. CAA11 TaxID=1532905 RepID=UPI000D34DBA0|nr:polysaccharide deacetylase family protein [Paenibacillus sp. CAA11]AWB45038.1 xylanase deacetylase [Paenibacillus sp. CAA11]